MRSKAYIKPMELIPNAPAPTRACRKDLSFLPDGRIVDHKPSPLAKMILEREARELAEGNRRGREAQSRIAHEKWDRMTKMARDGWSDREIAEALGYTEKYVRERIKRLRKSGVEIPERKKGRKCEKEH